jgi:putative LysE/RhtB family amino acid efflux pump
MSDLLLFGRSVLVGLAIAAPLGPIGALCVSRTLASGFAAGVAGGLGTALADASYAMAAAFGFAAFSAALATVEVPLKLGGGLFMLWLAYTTLRSRPGGGIAQAGTSRGLAATVATTYALTATNPATILSFAAIFAGLGLADRADPSGAALVVAGVFAGSMLWWILLSGAVALMRRRLPPSFGRAVARLSAALLAGFGVVAIGSALV